MKSFRILRLDSVAAGFPVAQWKIIKAFSALKDLESLGLFEKWENDADHFPLCCCTLSSCELAVISPSSQILFSLPWVQMAMFGDIYFVGQRVIC